MALIKCSECGKEFSDKASACPNCGCPTSEMVKSPIVEDQKDNLDAIWKTVPVKNNSSIKPHITQKVSAVKIDEVNRMFQIHGSIPNNGKKSGLLGKSFKGLMAVSTMNYWWKNKSWF